MCYSMHEFMAHSAVPLFERAIMPLLWLLFPLLVLCAVAGPVHGERYRYAQFEIAKSFTTCNEGCRGKTIVRFAFWGRDLPANLETLRAIAPKGALYPLSLSPQRMCPRNAITTSHAAAEALGRGKNSGWRKITCETAWNDDHVPWGHVDETENDRHGTEYTEYGWSAHRTHARYSRHQTG